MKRISANNQLRLGYRRGHLRKAEPTSKDILFPRKHWLRRFDDRLQPARKTIEASAIAHFIAIIVGFFALCVAGLTVWQIQNDLNDRVDERHDRWLEHLKERVASDSGKGIYLNRLIEANVPLGGLDLSCKQIGDWNEKTKTCDIAVVFSGVDLRSERFSTEASEGAWPLTQVKLYDQYFEGGTYAGSSIDVINFLRATFSRADLRYTHILSSTDGSPAELTIFSSDLSQSSIVSNALLAVHFNNISDTKWIVYNNISYNSSSPLYYENRFAFVAGNWFWADQPPHLEFTSDTTSENDENQLSNDTNKLFSLFVRRARICDPKFSRHTLEYRRSNKNFEPSPREIEYRRIKERFESVDMEPETRLDSESAMLVSEMLGQCTEISYEIAKERYRSLYK